LQAVQSQTEVPAAFKENQEQQFQFQPGNTLDAQAENTAMGQAMLIVSALGEAASAALQHSCETTCQHTEHNSGFAGPA